MNKTTGRAVALMAAAVVVGIVTLGLSSPSDATSNSQPNWKPSGISSWTGDPSWSQSSSSTDPNSSSAADTSSSVDESSPANPGPTGTHTCQPYDPPTWTYTPPASSSDPAVDVTTYELQDFARKDKNPCYSHTPKPTCTTSAPTSDDTTSTPPSSSSDATTDTATPTITDAPSSGSSAATTATAVTTSSSDGGSLANTGASVIGLGALASALMSAGLFLLAFGGRPRGKRAH